MPLNLRFPLLCELGISENEAHIYELLLIHGALLGRELAEKSPLSRTNVYNTLTTLLDKRLIVEKKGKQNIYEAVPPEHLRDLLRAQQQSMVLREAQLEGMIPALAGLYARSTHKPVVEIFEGVDGLKSALFDSLSATEPIRTYVDISGISGDLARINALYMKKRLEKKIMKHIIVADAPEAHAFFSSMNTPEVFASTKVRFVKNFPVHHGVAMEIYNDTVSILTLNNETHISLVITDPAIASMHKQHFDYIWGSSSAG